MAYQNVGTPRFYINSVEWLATNEIDITGGLGITLFNTLPVIPEDAYAMSGALRLTENVATYKKGFVAILGHVLSDPNPTILQIYSGGLGGYDLSGTVSSVVNFTNGLSLSYNGFTIVTTTDDTIRGIWSDYDSPKLGSIVIGTYYDMKNAPNLSLTMEREYGGTKEFTTHNGSSMSNTMWTKPPHWGNLGAWELQDGDQPLSKSGRRTWDLKFSYMDDGDLWGSNQTLGNLSSDDFPVYTPGGATYGADSSDYDPSDITDPYEETFAFNYNILTDDNFYSQVWHKTLGGTLPFIFQPDNSNNNPDQFAICRFKDSSLKATQTAFNVYDISLSIEEVW